MGLSPLLDTRRWISPRQQLSVDEVSALVNQLMNPSTFSFLGFLAADDFLYDGDVKISTVLTY